MSDELEQIIEALGTELEKVQQSKIEAVATLKKQRNKAQAQSVVAYHNRLEGAEAAYKVAIITGMEIMNKREKKTEEVQT